MARKDQDHRGYLKEAIKEAQKAFVKQEVPIGAVVVDENGELVGRGYNLTQTHGEVIGHAEIVALRKASRKVGDWRLEGCSLYVTVEPCLMCLGASALARISEIHFIVDDPMFGARQRIDLAYGAYKNIRFFQHPEMAMEVTDLMKEFFGKLRQKNRK